MRRSTTLLASRNAARVGLKDAGGQYLDLVLARQRDKPEHDPATHGVLPYAEAARALHLCPAEMFNHLTWCHRWIIIAMLSDLNNSTPLLSMQEENEADECLGPTIEFGMDLGMRIRQAREARGLTQVELAAAAGCQQNTISALERGVTTVAKADTLFGIADALRVSARWLAVGEGTMERDTSAGLVDEIAKVARELPTDKQAALLSIAKTLK